MCILDTGRFVIEHELDSLSVGFEGIHARVVGAKRHHRIDDMKLLGSSINSCVERVKDLGAGPV
jgi:hypothetical protein